MLNHHTAVRKIEPKGTFYFANGTGRDSYIYSDNGGLCPPPPEKAESTSGTYHRRNLSNPRNTKPRSDGRPIHYYPDGSGRDNYIYNDFGGFSKYQEGTTRNNFIRSLRTYERLRSNSASKTDYFEWAQRKLKSGDEITERRKENTVKDAVKRLSLPKIYGGINSTIGSGSSKNSEKKNKSFLLDKSMDNSNKSKLLNISMGYQD